MKNFIVYKTYLKTRSIQHINGRVLNLNRPRFRRLKKNVARKYRISRFYQSRLIRKKPILARYNKKETTPIKLDEWIRNNYNKPVQRFLIPFVRRKRRKKNLFVWRRFSAVRLRKRFKTKTKTNKIKIKPKTKAKIKTKIKPNKILKSSKVSKSNKVTAKSFSSKNINQNTLNQKPKPNSSQKAKLKPNPKPKPKEKEKSKQNQNQKQKSKEKPKNSQNYNKQKKPSNNKK